VGDVTVMTTVTTVIDAVAQYLEAMHQHQSGKRNWRKPDRSLK
jgi:hypothetical protein